MTFVILAGGKSRRMGTDKLILPAKDGLTLTENAVKRFSSAGRVLLSVDDPSRFANIDIPKVTDIYSEIGPIGGLHAVLSSSKDDVFLVAADMPFSAPAAAERIIELSTGYSAGVLTDSEGKFEPLFAFYSLDVLPVVNDLIEEKIYKMGALLKRVNTRNIQRSELGSEWNDNLLYNVNNPSDYEKLHFEYKGVYQCIDRKQ